MSRLIDADALLEQMKHRKDYVGRPSDPVCLIEDAPTVDGWVSVKDGLPEEDTDVLVWNHLGIEIAAYTTNPVKRWYLYNGQEVIAIYWMPLPDPPKEEN